MKLAFSTLACPAWSLEQVAAAAREYGYGGVELRLVDGKLIDAGMAASARARVRETFARAGLPIVAVDTSVRVAADPDPEAAIHDLRCFVEIAAGWGSPTVRVFGGEWPAGRSQDDAIAQARYVLGEASRDARRAGIAIALETHDRFSSAEMVAEVLRDLPPAATALWDVGHPHRAGDGPQGVVDVLGSRIAHVHIKDCRRNPDTGDWDLTLLGDGEVPVRECIDALHRSGYGGWLSVEWEKHWHPELAEPEVALPQFAAVLRSWGEG